MCGRISRTGGLVAIAALALSLACTGGGERSLAEIRAQHANGRYGESVDQLRGMVEADPENAELNFLLGEALYHTGNLGLAVWPLRRAAESEEFAVRANLLIADLVLQTREVKDAIEPLDRVLETEPDNVDALLMRSWAHLRGQRYEEAFADLERVRAIDPDHIDAIVPRAMAMIGLERFDEVEELLESARKELESAEEAEQATLASGLCAGAAALDFERGDIENAEIGFNACLEQYPSEPILVDAGVDFFDQLRNPERGTEILLAAFEVEPGRFRGPLIRRMQQMGEEEEVERLMIEWTEERPSPTSWYALGSYYTEREDYAGALNAFEQALALSPNPSPMLVFALGDTLIQLEEYERAEQVADKLEEGGYGDLLRGRAKLAQGKPEAALEAFDAGIRLWPNNAAARYLAAQAAEGAGDFARAISEYRESIRAEVGRTEAALDLAELHEAMGNYMSAFELIGRYVRAHAADPAGYVTSVRIGQRVGRQDVVAEGLRRLSLMPGHAGAAVALEAELVAGTRGVEIAVDVIRRSELDLTDPANADALAVMVEYLGDLGRADEALQQVDAALEAHPDQARFHVLRAQALSASGASAPALGAAYERALAIDAENAAALAGLGRLREEAGDVAAAVALYDRAAEADRTDPDPAAAAIRALLAAGKTTEAERRLEEMLRRHPRDARAPVELAGILLQRGSDADRAFELARRGVQFGGAADALEMLGWALLDRGDSDEAINAFNRALELDPSAVGARYRLGLALARTGDPEGAREAFRQVLESGETPETDLARAELARLESR
jgi:tetratricopeptide (TPR) repeat protein